MQAIQYFKIHSNYVSFAQDGKENNACHYLYAPLSHNVLHPM